MFACDRCGKEFHRKSILNSHVRKAHMTAREKEAERVKCEICQRVLSSRGTYKNHMAIHDGERSVRCTFCDQWFYTQLLMSQHRKKAHAAEWEEQKRARDAAKVFRICDPKQETA